MNQKPHASIETTFYIAGCCCLGFVLFIGIVLSATGTSLSRFLLPCAFHKITRLYCPGCGGTRAVLHLLHGHLLKSLVYHPFVIYCGVLGGWFMLSQTIERLSMHRFAIGMKYRDIYLWIGLVIVGLNFIVKNVLLVFWHIDLLTF